MHRIRQSINYFKEFGWNPIVVTVKPELIEGKRDEILQYTLPKDAEVIHINAFSTRWTRKIGLGSLGLRSLWFYKNAVNCILRKRKIDLIYFTTTMFPVMVLGNYWKKKFGVPYVIDMQDPWHSHHYLKLPNDQRPPKFWFSYRLNKYMEPIAMREVSGIIAVSQGYCDTLQKRYANIRPENCTVIPFGAYPKDFDVLTKHPVQQSFFTPGDGNIHIAYVGRGGHDMEFSLSALFEAFKSGLTEAPKLFHKVRFYFIGTSYAPNGKGKPTVQPLAVKYGVEQYVKEFTDRVPYFEAMQILKDADMLVIPGSTDPSYTASKLYPYIMAQKPLLAIFNQQSSVTKILKQTRAGEVVTFDHTISIEILAIQVHKQWSSVLSLLPYIPETDWQAFEPYSAYEMTRKQVGFFDKVIQTNSNNHEHSQYI